MNPEPPQEGDGDETSSAFLRAGDGDRRVRCDGGGGGSPAAQAYGHNGTLNMWQVGLSDNCNSPTACAGEQGGFWGWVQFTQDPATGATDGDADFTGCEHTTGGGPAGAVHEKIDVTGWIIAPGHIGDPTGPAAMTFWVTGGTQTDYFRGQVFTGPLTDQNGNPATPANPVDTGIPSTPGHYNTSAVFGVVPPPGISAQVQVAYKPCTASKLDIGAVTCGLAG